MILLIQVTKPMIRSQVTNIIDSPLDLEFNDAPLMIIKITSH